MKVSSEYRQHYLGSQFSPEKMGNLDIGPKETSGPINNEHGYVRTFDDPRRFITTYQTKYRKNSLLKHELNLFHSL